MVIPSWTCEICKTSYDTAVDAFMCETDHKEVDEVDSELARVNYTSHVL